MDLLQVTPDYLQKIWPKIYGILKTAVDQNDGFIMADVYQAISNGTMQLWIAADRSEIKGVGVTQIYNFPQKRNCLLLFTAGMEFDHWRHLLSDIERWAISQGCKDLEFYGRRGWLKKDLDYTPTTVLFRKIL